MLAEYRPESPQQREVIFFSDLPVTDALDKISSALPNWERKPDTKIPGTDYDFDVNKYTFSLSGQNPSGILEERLVLTASEGQMRTATLTVVEEMPPSNLRHIGIRPKTLDRVVSASINNGQIIIYGETSEQHIKVSNAGDPRKTLYSFGK